MTLHNPIIMPMKNHPFFTTMSTTTMVISPSQTLVLDLFSAMVQVICVLLELVSTGTAVVLTTEKALIHIIRVGDYPPSSSMTGPNSCHNHAMIFCPLEICLLDWWGRFWCPLPLHCDLLPCACEILWGGWHDGMVWYLVGQSIHKSNMVIHWEVQELTYQKRHSIETLGDRDTIQL